MSTLNAHKTIKLVVCGARGTGKTSIIARLTNNTFESDTPQTVGPLPVSMRYSDKTHGDVMLTIWEIPGSVTASMYFRGIHGAVLVVEQGEIASMECTDRQLALIQQTAQLPPKCVALCVAKVDRRRKSKAMEEQLANVVDREGIRIQDVSAQTGQGIEEVFADVIAAALDNLAERQRDDERAQKLMEAAGAASVGASPASSPVRTSAGGAHGRRSVPKNSIVREPVPFESESPAGGASPTGAAAAGAPGVAPGAIAADEPTPVADQNGAAAAPPPVAGDGNTVFGEDAPRTMQQGGCMKCVVM